MPSAQSKSSTSRGIPDIQFIKRHVPIADVARALDVCVVGNTAHCWRPDSHQHGDRTPSVWFSKRSNKGKCFVCDRFCWSNIDLVQIILGCGTATAVNWIAQRFNVPRIARRHLAKNSVVIPSGRVGCGSPVQELMRSGVYAEMTHATKSLLFVLLEFSDPTAKLSYRTLQRVTGIGSDATIKASLDTLEHMGLLKINRARDGDGLRANNSYRFSWDDVGLRRLMTDTHEASTREIKAQIEFRQAARRARAAYLGNSSLQPLKQGNDLLLQPLKQLSKEGKGPRPETLKKGTKANA